MLSSNNGITLMMLIITIIVLSILTAVTVSVGSGTFKEIQVQAYVSKMNMVQSRVNVISQKIENGDTSYDNIGTEISALSQTDKNRVNTILNGASSDGFKFYNEADLKELGVEKIDEEVIINLNTRIIYSMLGIKYDGTTYYNQYNLPNGVQVVDYKALQTQGPDFTIEKENYGLTVKVNITNIVYDEQINGSDIYYGEVTDSTTDPVTVNYWQRVDGISFQVTKTATYAVKVVDKNNGQTIKTVDVTTCNSPEITTGMVPVIYENGKWKKVQDNEIGKWYDYGEKKWANIMLSDELVINEDGTIDDDHMGSMFVWIPRYAYCITSGYQQEMPNGGTIDIKFLKNTTELTTDEKTTKMSDTAGQGNWIVHPVFKDGSQNNYAEGGWDRELTGFWVAKFEASGVENGSAVGVNSANTSKSSAVRSVPGVNSWRYITTGEAQYKCREMQSKDIYGWENKNVDSHLIKNSEWGAVSYLCYSKYGVIPKSNGAIEFCTGAGPYSDKSEEKYNYTEEHAYNTENGILASTTGNIYGIYDLAGGSWEEVAGYRDNGNYYLGNNGKSTTNSNVNYFSETEKTKNEAILLDKPKYWCRYEVGEEEKSNEITINGNVVLNQIQLGNINFNSEEHNVARLRLARENFEKMNKCKGIGINEVAQGFQYYGTNTGENFFNWIKNGTDSGKAWNDDIMVSASGTYCYILRGLWYNDTKLSGVFGLGSSQGEEYRTIGFRPTLVIE